ncbi:hypothetical protein SPB21_16080 [Leptothoe sp. ISB3NOV94-8A]
MNTVTIVLFAIAGITLCSNVWAYWLNSRYHTSDYMGASINFHAGNFMVGLFIGIGIALHISWPWWLGIIGLLACWTGSTPLMWLIHLALAPFRQPHPRTTELRQKQVNR